MVKQLTSLTSALLAILIATSYFILWVPPTPDAQAAFGVKAFDLAFSDKGGAAALQAGAHPFAMSAKVELNTTPGTTQEGKPGEVPDGELRDLITILPPGLVGKPSATPRCSTVEFIDLNAGGCPKTTVLGRIENVIAGEPDVALVYNLTPPPGAVMKLGFVVGQDVANVTLTARVSPNPPYNVIARLSNVNNVLDVSSGELTLWGVPASPEHDAERGGAVNIAEEPFLTVPRACQGPLVTAYRADSWEDPGAKLDDGEPDLSDPNWLTGQALTHDDVGPQGFIGCGALGFGPSIIAQPTTQAAQSPSGLDFSLIVEDESLTSPTGLADSDIRKAVVTLPPGMTANPSLAEGLEACSEAQLAKETAFSAPGAGCPEAAKVGTVEVKTPLLEETMSGALYIATPYENLAGDSLIALYMVIRNPSLGIIVKQAMRVEPDPNTGQLVTIAEDIPQFPLSLVRLHLREGGRSPLISPPGCGTHAAKATLYPWAGGPPSTTSSEFEIISGPNGEPCPPGGVAPFHPGFEAGTLSNAAGSYSPFYMRLTRKDGEQDLTKFSSVLPSGVVGKIAGLAKCPEAAIAAAKARTGPHGAQEEIDHPSCPASSRIGRTLAGAGVGSQLTYVPGSLYLAGPVGDDPLSAVAITPALAGPFDAGAVVVRVGLTLNPVTAQAETDGAHSDPIPHILKGIPLSVRDLRVYADKPEFTLNATNCKSAKAKATLFGSFLNVLDPADDVPVGLEARYRAAGCASLGFKPKLAIKLKGGTKRGDHPALKAVVTPRTKDANFADAVVTLPRSAFLDQAHIRTICTRVQFAAQGGNGAGCPQGAIYGQAKAWSPLLDEPLQGPVFLRSSNHNLPDLVIALHGLVDIEISSRLDSHKGGIRSSFADIPDAPVSRFILEMQGGKKGLIVNSRDLCQHASRANARLSGQNGREHNFSLRVQASGCAKAKRRGRAR